MAVVVQCTNCGKKLKMKQPAPGKKLRCPGCKEPFVPKAAAKKRPSGPKKKKRRRPAPVDDEFDDFGDDFADEGFDDEDDYGQPAPSRSKGGGKKKKKKAAEKKSKTPLFIGLGVLGLALAGGLAFMLMGGDDDSSSSTAAGNGDATAGGEGTGSSGGDDSSSAHGADALAAGTASPTTPDASSAAAAAPPASSSDSPIDLKWLPTASEVVAEIDVARLLGGPLGQLLQMPEVAENVDQFRTAVGVGPEDIQTVTIGVAGISDIVKQQIKPEDIPFVAVVRIAKAIDPAKLQAAIPGAMAVIEETSANGSVSLIRLPGGKPGEESGALWFADSNTAVVGPEAGMRKLVASPPTSAQFDTNLLADNLAVQVAFSPTDPDAFVNHPQFKVPPQAPPASRAATEAFKKHVTALSFGFDLTDDLAFASAMRCRDEAGAGVVVAAIEAQQKEQAAQADQVPPGMAMMLGPLMEIGKTLSESAKTEVSGNMCRFSASAEGGGQQLASFIPMAQMMIGSAMQAGPGAMGGPGFGPRPERDNLRNIALAMHNFHDAYGRFPNAASRSDSGEKLLSWRVHLLPFLGYEDLYDQFALDEPWDSPANRPLADQMPDIYVSKDADVEPNKSLYQVPVGPGTAFEESKGHSMLDFTDGTSTTLLIVEVSPDRAVYWSQPDDFEVNADNPTDGLGGVQPDGFRAAFADGSNKVISSSTEVDVVKGMMTRNGGERISP